MEFKNEFEKQYWELFVCRETAYAFQKPDGSYKAVHKSLTPELLFGEGTVGLYQLNEHNQVKWAVIDFDIKKEIAKDDPNFDFSKWDSILQNQVKEASDILAKNHVPHYIEFSGFRGYHIWIFFNKLTEAGIVKNWLKNLCDGLVRVNEAIEWELFPKQAELNANLGSLVKAPLQKHLRSGKNTFFLDREFKRIDGLPDIDFYDTTKIEIPEINIKYAPKDFSKTDDLADSKNKSFPTPDNIRKMIDKCPQVKSLVEKAQINYHLLNLERVIIASLGRFYGKEGLSWIHSVISNCKDYNEKSTDYYISNHTSDPVKCDKIQEINGRELCKGCKCKWNTPLGFGYTSIQQHFHATSEFIKKNLLPLLFEKLGLAFVEHSNHYEVHFNGSSYYINKEYGSWRRIFNIIDFIRFIRPSDWEYFLYQNFPDIKIDKFALERTEKKISEIFEYKGEVVFFNNYLSEASKKIEQILCDGNNYNLISQTGTGKSEAVIKAILSKGIKAIFLTPYESNAKQLEQKYKICSVYGEVKLEKVKDDLTNNNLIASTYDGLRKILNCQISPEEYILVIDEAHNLITHSNFRKFALDTVTENMYDFKKIINITGTPEGVLNNNYRSVKFVQNIKKQIISDYSILSTTENVNDSCIEHIIQNPVSGKVIIFKNSIKSLEVIKESLIDKGVKETEIKILHSSEKDGELYSEIVKKEQIPNAIKYILTTSVISDGVNIVNQNIDSVYVLECENLILLRQFLARFRKGVKNVYDLIQNNGEKHSSKKWFDFPIELQRTISLYERIAEEKTLFLRDCGLIQNYGRTNLLRNSFYGLSKELSFLNINPDTETVGVNHSLLTLNLLETFHLVAYFNPDKRKEYLEYFLSVPVKTVEYNSVSDNTSGAYEKVKNRMKNNRAILLDLLKENAQEVVNSYIKFCNPNMLKKVQSITGVYKPTGLTELFYQKNQKVIKAKDSEGKIQSYISLSRLNIPHTYIIKILELADHQIDEFLLNYFTQINLFLVKYHNTILKYNKKSLSVFYYAVFKFIYDHFQTDTSFTYEDLLQKLNSYLITQKISQQKMTKDKLCEIVNRIIVKRRICKKVNKVPKCIGWKKVRFKSVLDLAKADVKFAKALEISLASHIKTKLDFMNLNLFLKTFEDSGNYSTELRKAIFALRNDLEAVTEIN